MIPKYPRVNPDRDRIHNFYLCEDVKVTLSDGITIVIEKGHRFDGHTIPDWKIAFIIAAFGFVLGLPFTFAVSMFAFFTLLFALFPPFDTDVYAALVHDALLDTEMFHRYKRSFIDKEYQRFMEMPEYFATRTRRYFFPRIVRFFGYVKRTMWGR